MEKGTVGLGAVLLLIGIVGVVVGLFPPNDGYVAIAGAILFGSGIIAKAIAIRLR